MKRIPTLKNFPYNRIDSFRNINPYTIVYFYPKIGSPFVIKGGLNDCDKFIKRQKTPALLHMTYWRHGKNRSHHVVINTKTKIYIRRILENYKYMYDISTPINSLKIIKRVPRKWINELNDFV